MILRKMIFNILLKKLIHIVKNVYFIKKKWTSFLCSTEKIFLKFLIKSRVKSCNDQKVTSSNINQIRLVLKRILRALPHLIW